MRAAVLGTGIMGAAMARSLAREGHEVAVWNRTRARADEAAGDSITAYGSVREAVSGADLVITALFDADNVIAVADGMARIAAAASAVEDRLVDAPVLGTRKPAEDGTLVVLLSGPAAARDRVGWALDAIGSRTQVVGDEVGAASALKLVCNSWV